MNHNSSVLCEKHEELDPTFIGSFVLVSLGCGVILYMFLQATGFRVFLPFTLMLLLFGIFLGEIEAGSDFGAVAESITNWVELSPHVLMYMLLPPLLFTSGFVVNYHVFYKLANQAVYLAVIGVFIGAFITAVFCLYVFPYGWTPMEALMFGALLSATDPVAVVAMLHEVGAPDTIGVLIEGESLLNDGSAFVFFVTLERAVAGIAPAEPGALIGKMIYCSTIGPLCGCLVTWFVLQFMKFIWNDTIILIVCTSVVAWGSFFLGEATGSSGVLAVVAAGLFMAGNATPFVDPGAMEATKKFWQSLEFMANCVVFVYVGIIINRKMRGYYASAATDEFTWDDFLLSFLLFLALNGIRFVAILLQWFPLNIMGYGMDFKKYLVASWAGLRGALALASALFLVHECKCPAGVTTSDESPCLSARTADLMMFHTAGVVFLTLVVNAPLTKPLLKCLRINKKSAVSKDFFVASMSKLQEASDADIDVVKKSKEYRNVTDWDLVFSFVPVFSAEYLEKRKFFRNRNKRIGRQVDEHIKAHLEYKLNSQFAKEDRNPELVELYEARMRYLDMVKTMYKGRFEGAAVVSWPAMESLLEAVERAQDAAKKPMDEWESHLIKFCDIQGIYESPIKNEFFRKYVHNYILSGKLVKGYDIASSFVAAHTAALERFQTRIGFSEATKKQVIDEANRMIFLAKMFTRDVECAFPEISLSANSYLVIQKVLKSLIERAEEMRSNAEIDDGDLHLIEHEIQEKIHLLRTRTGFGELVDESELLRKSYMFRNLNKESKDRLASLTTIRVFNRGEECFSNMVSSKNLLIIVRGRVLIGMKKHVSGNIASEDASFETLTNDYLVQVADIIKTFGKRDSSEGGEATILFGLLHEKFVKNHDSHLSSELNRILVRGKRNKKFKFEGHMLFKDAHDDVKVTLLPGWFKESMRKAQIPDYPLAFLSNPNNSGFKNIHDNNFDFGIGATGHVYKFHSHHPAMGHLIPSLKVTKPREHVRLDVRPSARQTRSWSCDSDRNFGCRGRKIVEKYPEEVRNKYRHLRRQSIDLAPASSSFKKNNNNEEMMMIQGKKNHHQQVVDSGFSTPSKRRLDGNSPASSEAKNHSWAMSSKRLVVQSSVQTKPSDPVLNENGKVAMHTNGMFKMISAPFSGRKKAAIKSSIPKPSEAAIKPNDFRSYAIAGDSIGEMELLTGLPVLTSAICDTLVVAYEIPRVSVQDFLLQNPDGNLAQNLMKQAAMFALELHYQQLQKLPASLRKWMFNHLQTIVAQDNIPFLLGQGKAVLIRGYLIKAGPTLLDPPLQAITVFDSPVDMVCGVSGCCIVFLPADDCLLLEQGVGAESESMQASKVGDLKDAAAQLSSSARLNRMTSSRSIDPQQQTKSKRVSRFRFARSAVKQVLPVNDDDENNFLAM